MTSPVIASRIQNKRGTQSQFNGLVYNPAGPNSMYPLGYDGIGGYGSISDFTSENYPNVLLPGEIGFVTDTGRAFIGNVNGTYVEVGTGGTPVATDIQLLPTVIVLAPSIPTTAIPELEISATPFYTILYSITDSTSSDWNTPGTNYSANGTLTVTSITDGSGSASLTNEFTEIIGSGYTSGAVSFVASYDSINSKIIISYVSTFPTDITFTTSSIRWLPF